MKRITIILLFISLWLKPTWAQHPCSVAKIQSAQASLYKANATNEQMAMMERYDVVFHQLDLNIERTSKYISGSVRTLAKSRVSALDTFVFQLHTALTLDSVLGSNQTRLNVTRVADVAYVKLNTAVTTGNLCDVRIYYHGTPPTSGNAAIGDGFSNRASPTYGNQITWSLSQPYSAYEWWPCKQSLQDKIDSVFTNITTDSSNKAGSNGLLKSVITNGNKKTWRWETRYPMNYYLVGVAVGQYTEYVAYAKPKQITDSILVQNYIYSNPLAYTNNAISINATASMLENFSDLFGIYPFYKEKYGHMMAPFSGGMEHQTMTSIGIFNLGIVAHELAHQWFGDYVTCATWKDIWLNEGYASYCEYLSARFLQDSAAAAQEVRSMHFEARKAMSTVYVYDTTDVTRIFSGPNTYNRGASALRVLHYFLGDSLFFLVSRTYLERFANGNATTEDYRLLVNELSKKNYDFFFNQWIYGAGYPALNVKWNQMNGKLAIQVNQSNTVAPTNLFTFDLPVKVYWQGKDTLIRMPVNGKDNFLVMDLTPGITNIRIDPEYWILRTDTVRKDQLLNGLENENNMMEVSIYPNPASGIIHISFPVDDQYSISVLNPEGKEILHKTGGRDQQFNTDELMNGVYFFSIKNSSGHVVTRKQLILH